ncbi:MAG: PorT family protein, partial [Bacteroidales bacterium]|nr:PorT family protein [Bacteroidales bacterium]
AFMPSIKHILFRTGIVAITLFAAIPGLTQKQKKLESPFMLGMKGGINFSHPGIMNSYQLFTSIGDEPTEPKDYALPFRNFGYQYGFVGLYKLNDRLNILLEPTFSHYKFVYTTTQIWQEGNGTPLILTREQEHAQKLRYVEIPLSVQISMDRSPWNPYAVFGATYGYLLGAEKLQEISEFTEFEGVQSTTTTQESRTFTSDQFIRSRISVKGGIGISYHLPWAQIMFDITYHYNFHNITNETNRHGNQTISGSSYDVDDDIKLNAYAANISVVFPFLKESNLVKSLKCNPKR